MLAFFYLLCFIHLFPTSLTDGHEDYGIEPLDNNPGLYYEQLSPVRLKQTDWKVYIAIDINRFIAKTIIIQDLG